MNEKALYGRCCAGVGEVKRQRPYLIVRDAQDRVAQSALRWRDLKLVKAWKTGKWAYLEKMDTNLGGFIFV